MVQILHLCIVHTLFIPRIHIQPDRLTTLSPIALPNIKSSEIVSSSYSFTIRILLSHFDWRINNGNTQNKHSVLHHLLLYCI